MKVLRSKQIWLAAMTLVLQCSSVIVLTVGFCCESPPAEAKHGPMPCHQTGEHAACPMMKHHGHGATGSSGPSMRSCCDPDAQALLALIGTVGLAPSPSSMSFALDRTGLVIASAFALPDWISPVDLPPPRA